MIRVLFRVGKRRSAAGLKDPRRCRLEMPCSSGSAGDPGQGLRREEECRRKEQGGSEQGFPSPMHSGLLLVVVVTLPARNNN